MSCSKKTPIRRIYYFASSLKRTRQALQIIDGKMREYNLIQSIGPILQKNIPQQTDDENEMKNNVNTYVMPTSIIVLPCLHELAYTGTNCDAKNAGKLPQPKNRKTCKTTCPNNKCTIDENNFCCCVKGLSVDWSQYNKFYTNKNNKCRSTNFLVQLKNVIDHDKRTFPSRSKPLVPPKPKINISTKTF